MNDDEKAEGFYLFGLYFPIYRELLIRATLITWVLMLLVLFISMYFFQYEMTTADLPCGAVAGVLLGYLYTLVVHS